MTPDPKDQEFRDYVNRVVVDPYDRDVLIRLHEEIVRGPADPGQQLGGTEKSFKENAQAERYRIELEQVTKDYEAHVEEADAFIDCAFVSAESRPPCRSKLLLPCRSCALAELEQVKKERDEAYTSLIAERDIRRDVSEVQRDRLASQVSAARVMLARAVDFWRTRHETDSIPPFLDAGPSHRPLRQRDTDAVDAALQPPTPEPPAASPELIPMCARLSGYAERRNGFPKPEWVDLPCPWPIPCPVHDKAARYRQTVTEEQPVRQLPCEYCGHRKGEWPNREEER